MTLREGMAQHPRSRFVSAVGNPPGRRIRRRRLSLPRENIRERLWLDTLQPSVNMTGKLPEY